MRRCSNFQTGQGRGSKTFYAFCLRFIAMTEANPRPQLAHLTAVLDELRAKGTLLSPPCARRSAGAGVPLRWQRSDQPGQQQLPWAGESPQADPSGSGRHPHLRCGLRRSTYHRRNPCGCTWNWKRKIARFKNVEACVCVSKRICGQRGHGKLPGFSARRISSSLTSSITPALSMVRGFRGQRSRYFATRMQTIANSYCRNSPEEPGRKLVITDGVFSMDGDIVGG